MNRQTAHRRLALVVASMRMGGVERMTLNLAPEFVRRGWDVDLVLVQKAGPLVDQIPSDIRIIDLGAKHARSAIAPLRRYLRRERPEALLSAAWEVNILTMLAMIGLRSRPRTVLSVRNTLSAAMAANGRLTGSLFKLATRLLYPHANHVVAVSNGAADDLRRNAHLARDHVGTIYNPVIAEDFDRLLRESAGLPPRDPAVPRIISVGRLTRQKDHATLLRAFAKLRERRPAELIIVGDGELRAALERLAAELGIAGSVTFTGVVGNPYPYIRESDLFVFSSLWEGFGNVLVEAMATGTPVISTDCPHGPREILDGGKWGLLVPPGDADAMADAMETVITGSGIDARERAAEFTVARAADRYLELLSG